MQGLFRSSWVASCEKGSGMVVLGPERIQRKLLPTAALLALLPVAFLGVQPATAQQAEWEVEWQAQSRAQGTQPSGARQPGVQEAGELPAVITVLPPRRPAGLSSNTQSAGVEAPIPAMQASAPAAASPVPAAPPPAPLQIATASPEPVAVASAPLSDAEIVSRANDYFNAITMMSGRFTQAGANGSRVSGTLYVHRPGRVRFAYDEPATIDVISDGRSVVVRDRRLATQDLYPVSQTPLKFLIGDRVELGRTIPVVGVERTSNETDVILQDSTTFGGTSRITLTFDAQVRELKQWRIMDPQGFETTVTLSNLNRSARVDPSLFEINYQPIWN